MHARVMRAEHHGPMMGQGIEIFHGAVAPEVEQLAGFHGMLFLTNQDTHQIMVVTLWETEAEMKAGEASGAYHAQVGKVAHLFTGPPTREEYEVQYLGLK